jgi:hypothetical protein
VDQTRYETGNSTKKLTRHDPLILDNAVILLVDHWVGLCAGVRDIDSLEIKHKVAGLA